MVPLKYTMDTASALLALRFWDQALEAAVAGGLVVTATPATGPPHLTRAVSAGASWYVFRRLPGLADRTGVPAGSLPFRIEVWDTAGRFQPISFPVDLPLPGDGTFRTPESVWRTREDGNWVTLCSARSRRAVPGLAMITGQIVGPDRTPAAGALLAVETGSGRWYGIADEQGCLTLLFPYPSLRPGQKLQWDVTLSVRYGGLPDPPIADGAVDPFAAFRQINQLIYPAGGGAPVERFPATIRFGEVFILTGDTPSALRVGGSR